MKSFQKLCAVSFSRRENVRGCARDNPAPMVLSVTSTFISEKLTKVVPCRLHGSQRGNHLGDTLVMMGLPLLRPVTTHLNVPRACARNAVKVGFKDMTPRERTASRNSEPTTQTIDRTARNTTRGILCDVLRVGLRASSYTSTITANNTCS